MKNAIVTGATKGIGLAIAKMLISDGFNVTATYGNDDAAAEICRNTLGDKAEIVKVDMGNKEMLRCFTAQMRLKRHIDCLVCNAATTLRKPLMETRDDEWEHIMQVNLNSNVYLIRDLMNVLTNDARIVFIGSLMGMTPHSTSLAYGVSKAAVTALAKNLVKEFAGTKTTVNVIAPGFVETEWQKSKPEEIRRNICNKTAAGRFARPEEIADAVRFCLNNPFVNGSVIEVSGGYDYK